MRKVSKIIILASAIIAANYFANPRTNVIVRPQFQDDALAVTQVGSRKLVIENSGQVNWVRDGKAEAFMTLDAGILAQKENLNRLVRTLAAGELALPAEKFLAES